MFPASRINYIADKINYANRVLVSHIGDTDGGILTFDKDNNWGAMNQKDMLAAHISILSGLIYRENTPYHIPGEPLPKEISSVLKKHIDELKELRSNTFKKEKKADTPEKLFEALAKHVIDSLDLLKDSLEKNDKKGPDDKCPTVELQHHLRLIKSLRDMMGAFDEK